MKMEKSLLSRSVQWEQLKIDGLRIIILLMSTTRDSFFSQSPRKVLTRAELYAQTLQKHHELPKAMAKSMVVRQLAEAHKEEVEYAIDQSKYQTELFRRKEEADHLQRSRFEQRIASSAEKVKNNEREISKKKAKEADNYSKHLHEIYKRYEEEEKKHRSNEKDEAYKLRKELQQFYSEEQERKMKAAHHQVAVGTCYQSAVDRINGIHRRNEEYSLKAQAELQAELNKNSHYPEILGKKKRALSSVNRSKSKIYDQNLSILSARQDKCIQKYANNEEGSLSAWKHIDEDCNKTKKRLGEFFKKRVEHWAQQKHRVDEKKAQVPHKCLSILDKTSKATFRNTMSTFRSSGKDWDSVVQKNKSAIREMDELQKDKIMNLHLDLRLVNDSSADVNDKMHSLRHQARKLAYDYL